MSQVQRPAEHRRVLSYHERYDMDATGAETYCRVIAVSRRSPSGPST